MNKKFLNLALAASLVSLAACGGGGGGGDDDKPAAPAAEPAQGLWQGSTDTGRTVTGIVLADGTYYFLYSPPNDPSRVAGVVQGQGRSSGSTFSSGDARDFNLEGGGVASGTVSASFAARQRFDGKVTGQAGSVRFDTTYDRAYETVPTLAAIAGTYAGEVALSPGLEGASVTIAASGAISGSGGSGCAFSGQVTPRSDGNVYTLQLRFGAAPCQFAGQTLQGVAYLDAPRQRLYAAAPNASRSDGVLFLGTRR